MFDPGTIIFATDDSDDGIADARDYIKRNSLTPENVKFIKRGGQCLIIIKKAIDVVKPIS